MSLLPQTTSVFIVGPDMSVRSAVARLLSLDREIEVIGTSEDRESPLAARASIIIDEALLRELKDVSIGKFIQTVKSMPKPPTAQTKRHLVPLPGSAQEMRSMLSERELQVVRLVAEGLSNKEISRRMELSDKTVKNHISHILAKLHLTARTQIAVHALRTGLA